MAAAPWRPPSPLSSPPNSWCKRSNLGCKAAPNVGQVMQHQTTSVGARVEGGEVEGRACMSARTDHAESSKWPAAVGQAGCSGADAATVSQPRYTSSGCELSGCRGGRMRLTLTKPSGSCWPTTRSTCALASSTTERVSGGDGQGTKHCTGARAPLGGNGGSTSRLVRRFGGEVEGANGPAAALRAAPSSPFAGPHPATHPKRLGA